MADKQKNSDGAPGMESFTVWLSKAQSAKLNRLALAQSSENKLISRADVVRNLIDAASVKKQTQTI